MAAEASGQGPTILEQISVSFIEEKEFILDPYLFALSGSNLQQYCTVLSWLEQQNPKPQMFLEIAQGVSMPLSLVQVVEEFELLPYSYQEDGTRHTKSSEPSLPGKNTTLVELQYNFMPTLGNCIFKREPFSSSAAPKVQEEVEVKSTGLVSPKVNLSTPPELLKADRDREGQNGEPETTIQQREDSPQPPASHFFDAEESNERTPEGPLQNTLQEESRSHLLPGHHSRRECSGSNHHPGEVFLPTDRNHSSDHLEGCASESRSRSVPKGMASCACPACGNHFRLNQNPLTPPRIPSDPNSFQCPECGHSVRGPTGGRCQRIPACRQDGQLSHRWIQKDGKVVMLFRCPVCGRGFEHKSSLSRHWKLYHKENKSSSSEPPKSFTQGLKHFTREKAYVGQASFQGRGLKTVRICRATNTPTHRHDPQTSPQSNTCREMILPQPPGFQGNPTCLKKPFVCLECGKRFTTKASVIRHQPLHRGVRPFKCPCCDKGYVQKSHLKRHSKIKHGCDLLQRESF